MQSAYLESISMMRALRLRRSQAISVLPDPPNKSATLSPGLAAVQQCALDQLHRLHSGVQTIRRWLLFLPERRLRLVAVPGVLLSSEVAVEHRLMLELVAAEAPCERILRPDDLAANLEAGCFEGVLELALPGRGVADVQRGARFHCASARAERSFQE